MLSEKRRNMEYKDFKLPDELMPEKELFETAAQIDRGYLEMYGALRKDNKGASPYDVVTLIARVATEHVALQIGANLRDYDKKCLMSVIRRHIIGIVSRG